MTRRHSSTSALERGSGPRIWVAWLVFVLCLVLCPLWQPPVVLHADVGPKPTMTFNVVFETERPLEIVGGQQMQCEAADCSDARPLEKLGPQAFHCDEDSCSSMAYGYATYNQLVLTFSDGVARTSNVFSSGMMNSTYRVTVREKDLHVERVREGRAAEPLLWALIGRSAGTAAAVLFGAALLTITVWLIVRAWRTKDDRRRSTALLLAGWVVSLPLLDLGTAYSLAPAATLLVEELLILAYAIVSRQRILGWLTHVLLVNMISQPALWLVVVSRGAALPYPLILVAVEPLIWVLEAGLFFGLRGQDLTFGRELLLSLVINAASFLVGLLLSV